jgi:hypothetical protein
VVVIPGGRLEQVLALAAEIEAEDTAMLPVIRAEHPLEVLRGKIDEN